MSGDVPPVMFHGTRIGIKKGGYLVPGEHVGKDNHGLGRSDAVYVTPDYDLAAAFARVCRGRGRPKVLTVVPMDDLEVDRSTVGGDEHESYRIRNGGWALVAAVEVVEP